MNTLREHSACDCGTSVRVCAASLIAAIAMSGCAGLETSRVADDSKAEGFRYYEVAPFLFIHTDGKGGLTSEIVWLPDTMKLMQIKPYATLASNDATLTFSNGVLTEAQATIDQTVVAGSALDALAKFLGVALAADLQKQTEAPPPYLYKITISGNTVTLHGGGPKTNEMGETEFRMKLPEPAAEGAK